MFTPNLPKLYIKWIIFYLIIKLKNYRTIYLLYLYFSYNILIKFFKYKKDFIWRILLENI